MRDTTLLQLALGLTPPWTVTAQRLRRRGAPARHPDRLRPGQPLRLPDLRRGGLPGLRHRAENLAPPQLLPAPGLSERPRAARALRDMRHQDGQRAVGAAGQRLHPAVRGDGDDHGLGHAGQGRGPDGGRARHPAVARGSPLCRAGAGARRRLGRDPGRHRRDRRPARPRLHHAVRRYRPGPRAVRHRGQATPTTVAAFADDLAAHGGDPEAIERGLHRHEPGLHQGRRREPARTPPSPSTSSTPSRSSTMPSIRYAAPNRRAKACCAAHVTSGCAIRTTCPTGRQAHSRQLSQRVTSRPRAPTRSAWPSRTSTISHLSRRARAS